MPDGHPPRGVYSASTADDLAMETTEATYSEGFATTEIGVSGPTIAGARMLLTSAGLGFG